MMSTVVEERRSVGTWGWDIQALKTGCLFVCLFVSLLSFALFCLILCGLVLFVLCFVCLSPCSSMGGAEQKFFTFSCLG